MSQTRRSGHDDGDRIAVEPLHEAARTFLAPCPTASILLSINEGRIGVDWTNTAYEQLSGEPCERTIGKRWEEIVDNRKAPGVALTVAGKLPLGTPGQADVWLRCGREGPVRSRFSWTPLPAERDGAICLLGQFSDISDLHAEFARERTAKRAARAALRRKSDFFAMMSHEIRTPMNSIIGFADLLAGTPLNSEQGEYVQMIENNTRGLLKVLNDILDFSKIESGRLRLDIHPFKLREVVSDTIRQIEPNAAVKGIDLRLDIDPSLPTFITADAQRLRQILLNLLTNAEKFTQSGQIHMQVKVVETPKGTPTRIGFSIKDTGIGIPEDRIAALFEEFTQVDYSTARLYGGTGLGLVVAQRLCRLMGGNITVRSESGSGAEFKFEIATESAINPDHALPHRNRAKNYGEKHLIPSGTGPELSILVAEDNTANLLMLERMLGRISLSCDTVRDGEAAITAALKKRYDLILLDLQMPKYDGIEVAKRVRLLEASPAHAVPKAEEDAHRDRAVIIAITANTLTHTREQCLAAGMDHYLAKPLRQKVFAQTLGQYFPSVLSRL